MNLTVNDSVRPYRWEHTANLPQRGDGRGLGKPIRKDGKWIGQSRCDVISGKQVFRQFDANGNLINERGDRRFNAA